MKHFFLRLLLMGLTLVWSAQLYAQGLDNVVSNGDFSRGLDAWIVSNPGKAQVSIVEANIGEATRAVHVNITTEPADKPWSVQLRQKLNVSWKKGEAMKLVAWMRSAQKSKVRPIVEAGATVDYAKSLTQEITLSPEWTKVEVAGAATGDFVAGDLTLGFQLGYGTGSVEMTAVRLLKAVAQDQNARTVEPDNPTLDKPQSLIHNSDFSSDLKGAWSFSNNSPRVSLVDVQGQSFKRALHLEVDTATENPWDVRVATPKIIQPLATGLLLGVRFWARSPQKAQIGVRFQKSQPPHDKILSQNVGLSPEWKEYRFYTRVSSPLTAESTQFEFHLGYGPGTIELADVRVEHFGTGKVADLEAKLGAQSIAYWLEQARDDRWKKAALSRIERYRKGDLKLRIVDARGRPIPNANIKLMQTRQLFHWGSAVNATRLTDTQNPDNLRYQTEVKRLFNTIVFENDLKWTNDTARRTKEAMAATNWLRANKIAVRGHTLVWGSRRFLPKVVSDNWNDTEKLRQLVRERVQEAAQTWKGQVYVWDAVNEAVTNTELWDKLGWDEFANVYKIARKVDSNVKLAYNDYNISNESQSPVSNSRHRARVIEIVQLLQAKGAPLDILGDQAHFGPPLTPPSRVVEIWSDMAKLGLPLEITEYDAAIPDDALHGEYTRDILIAAFAEPKIQSFLMWGFWEGAHWRANEGGAMFHKDWTPRPAQLAYEDLVLKQWITKEQLKSDKNGTVHMRGFLGDYEANITVDGREKQVWFSLGPLGLKQQITF